MTATASSESYALNDVQTAVLKEADPCIQRVAKTVANLLDALQRQAGDVATRLDAFLALEQDLADLIGHSDKLSDELERARPGTPAHKNAQEASRRAITRMFKVLAAQETALQQLNTSAGAVSDKLGLKLADVQEAVTGAKEYVASYKQSAKAYEEEAATEEKSKAVKAAAEEERPKRERSEREKAEKKEKKERKRSRSPEKRSARAESLRYA